MKSVLIWGTGSVAAMYCHWLFKQYEVLAFVNNESDFPDTLLDKPVIRKESMSDYEYDIIVIAALPENAMSIRQDAIDMGVDEGKLYKITDLFYEDEGKDYYVENTV